MKRAIKRPTEETAISHSGKTKPLFENVTENLDIQKFFPERRTNDALLARLRNGYAIKLPLSEFRTYVPTSELGDWTSISRIDNVLITTASNTAVKRLTLKIVDKNLYTIYKII